MKRIGITGQNGFVGKHLYNTLGLYPDFYQRIEFQKSFFDSEVLLDQFVKSCDVIIHLAGMNRHGDPQVIYDTNVSLANNLVNALKRTGSKPHIIFSSSSQEERDNIYGKSKKDARLILSDWANSTGAVFTGMVIPNVFGPFGHPFYNSVIATFCHQVARNETPKIEIDNQLKLIYIDELVKEIIQSILDENHNPEYFVQNTSETKVSDILNLLLKYKDQYLEKGEIPILESKYEYQLFNTFRCYIDIKNYFPKKFIQHVDARGAFVEIIRLGIGGQVSFSTTLPGVTRGNHYHTRKIERFAVIKGKALIQLRRIGTNEVYEFFLDGEEPSFVDMPIWYTHNIKNIGEDVLYTNFWINEPFDPNNPDTFFETV